MSSDIGKLVHVSIFGESHGDVVGVMIDGLPAGEKIDIDELQVFLDRRRPGKNSLSSKRSESDKPVFLSGIHDNITCGTPICAVIPNTDHRPSDYTLSGTADNSCSTHTGQRPSCRSSDFIDAEDICYSSAFKDTEDTCRSSDFIDTEDICRSSAFRATDCTRHSGSAGIDKRHNPDTVYADTPRPGHADFTAGIKFHGFADMRGGGHFSGRLTAPLCIAGGIAKQILSRKGIFIGAHLFSVGGICDTAFPLYPDNELFTAIAQRELPVIDDAVCIKMQREIEAARDAGDSVGGIIEVAAIGLPSGIGGPLFGGVESRLAEAYFGIPAVKGVEFGQGFLAAVSHGSDANDEFTINNDKIATRTNNCGGILGGITTGMPLTARLAVKPTPSISKIQHTVCLSEQTTTEISIHGRHDPCIALRAVPVVEAASAIILLDMFMEAQAYK